MNKKESTTSQEMTTNSKSITDDVFMKFLIKVFLDATAYSSLQ